MQQPDLRCLQSFILALTFSEMDTSFDIRQQCIFFSQELTSQ